MQEILFFLPYIIFLGVITSYTDIKYGKIRNKWLLLGLIYAIIMYSIIIIFYSFDPTTVLRKKYLVELLTNFLFSIFLGYGLWCLGMWTAADGKLFITYSALIPLSVYYYGYQRWIPSTTLFLNTFSIGLITILGFMICKLKIKDIQAISKSFFKDLINPKKLFHSAIALFAIVWIVKLLLSLIGLGSNLLLVIILTIFVFFVINNKIGKKSIWLISAPLVILRLIIDKSVYSLEFLRNFLILILIWIILKQFFEGEISNLGRRIFSKGIKTSELKEGMLLAETIIQKGNKFEKKTKPFFSINKSFMGEEAEGLTRDQIKKIKLTNIKNIRIAQTIPFAPILFFGAILTIIARGNIFILIRLLI